MRIAAAVIFFSLFLVLEAKDYRGAEYRTKNYFTYGRFEVRMKSAHREGMLSSFFTYNDSFPATPWNEIDIEILGRYTDDVQFNPITPGQVNHEVHYQTPFNPAQDFHTYGFEWAPTYVAWFVDGKEVHRQVGAHIQALNLPQKIMMNIWNPSYANWVGLSTASVLPAFAYYDWVSYSTYAPDSGDTGTNNNFKFQWKDDFNSFDTTRWEHPDPSHTWGGNLSTMYPENIVFKNGVMILCLTTSTTFGYYDKTEPTISYARAENGKIKVHYTEEVEQESAEMPSNYFVTNNSVASAKLQPDSQTVYLTVAKYDTSTLSNIIVINTNDRFYPANALTVRNVSIVKQKPIVFPLKINCGGAAYADYLGDQEWGPGVEYGHVDGKYNSNAAVVSGAADATIYHSELNMPVKYFIRVPNGIYDVELQMAETSFSGDSSRIFSIAVQDSVVVQNLDLAALVGKNVAYTKVIKNVIVDNEMIDIHFMASKNYAIINGIIVAQTPSKVHEREDLLPTRWNVGQNYPNPFNGGTVIPVEIAYQETIAIRFYDILGRQISELAVGNISAGKHYFRWDAKDFHGSPVASGIYFYSVSGTTFSTTKKLMLLQ